MGGNNKQAQRVKNNARPSSSSRSAELLSHQNKDVRFIPPTLSLLRNDELDTALSPDFQLIFKKLHKKDSTTKLKALQELSELIASVDVEIVKSTVGVWASLYPLLVTDLDHRIREAVHNAQFIIITKDKKLIAPHLKQIIGAWFTSQYDNYPPAASAAAKAFHIAFPGAKLQDCLVFCHKEILNYIKDNLNANLDTKDPDLDAKYERVTVACLQGYALFMQLLDNEKFQKYSSENEEIVNSPRFFKLANHKSAPVRGAWFNLVGAMYQKGGPLLDILTNHVVPIVFANLDEAEPSVVVNVWETAVLIINSSQEWWKYVSFEKSFVAKLKKVLRDGCMGNASAICPTILTFLHHLPASLRFDSFAEAIFDSMRLGLKKKSVQASQSESAAITAAFMECLQYVLIRKMEDRDDNVAVRLVKNHFFPLLEHSLLDSDANFKQFYNQIAVLVDSWYRNNNATTVTYRQMFWSHLAHLFQTLDYQTCSNAVEKQLLLLHSLKNKGGSKQRAKVVFNENTNKDCAGAVPVAHPVQSSPNYMADLVELAYVTLRTYVLAIETYHLKELQQPLHSIVQLFESQEFFIGLAKVCLNSQNLVEIYEKLLYNWLKSSELCTDVTVDLAFLLFKHLDNSEKEKMLQSMLEFTGNNCFDRILQNSFVHPHQSDLSIRQWLKQKPIGDYLIHLATDNLGMDCSPQKKVLFKMAMTENEDGELLLNEDVVEGIIETLKSALESTQSPSIDASVHLVSFVSTVVYTETCKLKYGTNLLMSMFKFSTFADVDSEFLTEDTLLELTTSWEDVVAVLSKCLERVQFMQLVRDICDVTLNYFTANQIDDCQRLIRSLTTLIKIVFLNQPMWIGDVYTLLFQSRFLKWKDDLVRYCTTAEYLIGNCQNCPQNDQVLKMTDEDILKFFQWVTVEMTVLTSQFQDDEEDDEEENESQIGDVIAQVIDDGTNVILELFFKCILGELFLGHYKMCRYYTKLTQLCVNNKANCKNLTMILKENSDVKSVILNKLVSPDTPNSNGLIWCHLIHYYYVTLLGRLPRDVYLEFSRDVNNCDLFRFFASDLSFDDVRFTGSLQNDITILRGLLHCEEIDVQIAQIVQRARQLRVDCPQNFLFDSVLIDDEVINIVHLFSDLLATKHEHLSDNQWDFAVISLCSWSSNCLKHRSQHDNIKIRAMMLAVCRFYTTLNELVTEGKLGTHFKDEWNDILLPDIHNDLLQFWLYLAEFYSSKAKLSLEQLNFLQNFEGLVGNFHWKFIFRDNVNLMSWSKIIKRCCQLLTNNAAILQLWGYKMLLILIKGLVEIDLKWNDSTMPNTKGLTFAMFKDVLDKTHTVVETILHGFRLGDDSCTVAAFTDSYTYVFGYLLIWSVLLSMCELSPPELRYQYADILRNDTYFKTLLGNIFKLVPAEILRQTDLKSKHITGLFLDEPALTFRAPSTSDRIEHLACWLYTRSLSQLPALVRQWWTETDTKATQFVDKVTSLYVSQHLCQQELLDVATNHNVKFKNMTIKVIPSVREVVAVYTVDEAQMELVISLPANYPLGGPQVRCSRQIGGVLHKQWLMQLKKCLLHQNGRIWDGLSLWNSNLDKKFDGVEECYICFAILHPGTYQLPKLSCQTCKKKFHSACLYKWFSTSNKSSCPICRNLF